jgi:hypothetical protein
MCSGANDLWCGESVCDQEDASHRLRRLPQSLAAPARQATIIFIWIIWFLFSILLELFCGICVANSEPISKSGSDFQARIQFPNPYPISKSVSDFQIRIRFPNPDPISKFGSDPNPDPIQIRIRIYEDDNGPNRKFSYFEVLDMLSRGLFAFSGRGTS